MTGGLKYQMNIMDRKSELEMILPNLLDNVKIKMDYINKYSLREDTLVKDWERLKEMQKDVDIYLKEYESIK
jgi:hypothetical protein